MELKKLFALAILASTSSLIAAEGTEEKKEEVAAGSEAATEDHKPAEGSAEGTEEAK